MTATLADLYTRYSARLAAHVAELLAAAGAELIADAEDIVQDTWMWAAQQRRLPGWEGLSVMAGWVIEAETEQQRDRPETAVGLRPSGTPVWESDDPPVAPVEAAERPVVVERVDGTRAGVDAWYTARRDAAGRRTDAVIDQITVVVTKRDHWYRTDDARNGNNDWICRGCGASGHFAYILDSHGSCTKPATVDAICAVLSAANAAQAAPHAAASAA
ncbi:hypothetical protein ACFRR7_34740 [Streptomyces sp. NPDC056909]|uniref:hypothetical protein n=1 Tax=Streptomyces sp. NPDC056909 TaxID=3345963 RepID=UPI00368F616A